MKSSNRDSGSLASSRLLLITTVAAAAAGVGIAYYRRSNNRKKEHNKKTTTSTAPNNNKTDDTNTNDMERIKTVERKFEECCEQVKNNSKSMKLSNTIRLELYGLYKQATVGDATDAPSGASMVERAKHASWLDKKGMTKFDAMMYYIGCVIQHQSQPQPQQQKQPAATATTTDGEDEEDDFGDDDFIDNDDDDNDDGGFDYFEELAGNSGVFGSNRQSLPVVIDEEDDNESDTGGGGAGTTNDNDNENENNNSAIAGLTKELLRSVVAGRAEKVREVLAALKDKDATSIEAIVNGLNAGGGGQSVLHLAADKGYLEIVRLLIEEGNADANASDGDGTTILHTAVIAGRYEICEYLLSEAKADPQQPDTDGDTPHSYALDADTCDNEDIRNLFLALETKQQ